MTRSKRKRAPGRNVSRSEQARGADRLRAWREQHLYSLFSSIGRMLRRPWTTALTVGVLAMALVLPLCLAMLINNAERVSGDFREARDLSLFLTIQTTVAESEQLAARLREDRHIEGVVVRSAAQGLEEFREMADFADALAVLDDNPLPAVLVVTPVAMVEPMILVQQLRDLPEVEFIQHDALWRARLTAWLEFGRHLAWVAVVLLGIGVLLVVGNTVRLDIQGRAEEIQTVQLLGATDGFVRRPFLYLGAWYGLLGGIVALLVAALVPWLLQAPVAALTDSYGSHFQLQGLGFRLASATLVGGLGLGWLGAWLAAGHHLRRGVPGDEVRG